MEEALYRVGAHIVFKQTKKTADQPEPTNKMKVPVPMWRKRQQMRKNDQRIVGGIPRDPIDKTAAIVTSKTPIDCRPQ
jgi:hypothetical protein